MAPRDLRNPTNLPAQVKLKLLSKNMFFNKNCKGNKGAQRSKKTDQPNSPSEAKIIKNKKSYNILKCDNGRCCWTGWIGDLISVWDRYLSFWSQSVVVLSKNKLTSTQKSHDIRLIHKRLLQNMSNIVEIVKSQFRRVTFLQY